MDQRLDAEPQQLKYRNSSWNNKSSQLEKEAKLLKHWSWRCGPRGSLVWILTLLSYRSHIETQASTGWELLSSGSQRLMRVCAPCVFLVPVEARGGLWIPWAEIIHHYKPSNGFIWSSITTTNVGIIGRLSSLGLCMFVWNSSIRNWSWSGRLAWSYTRMTVRFWEIVSCI